MIEKRFVLLWAAWALLALSAEFLWGWRPDWSVALFALAAVWFVAVEVWAVVRDGEGDTLSEMVWSFLFLDPAPGYRDESCSSSEIRHARLVLVLGAVVWIAARLFALMSGDEIAVLVGRLALTIGIGAWLALHFYRRGRWG